MEAGIFLFALLLSFFMGANMPDLTVGKRFCREGI
jgi:hypothetical protein